jgi:hydroxyethylthiazole kinase-like uncharacterized protein yjeF
MRFSSTEMLFTPDDMTRVDAAAKTSGLSTFSLMQRAGQAVSASALRHYPSARRFVVLCGTGNNGGDGYVAATALFACGANVALYYVGDRQQLKGDARLASAQCLIEGRPLDEYFPNVDDVVIDAVFGAGLSRDVPAVVAEVIRRVTDASVPVIAVDLPSGLCGRRGVALGASFKAERTVTFMAMKPGHLLMPGRELCGALEVFDIGIPVRILASQSGALARNVPFFWQHLLPRSDGASHKFKRGHLTVFSGPSHATGAARLCATAGLRSGAGLVSVAAPHAALDTLAASLTAVMLTGMDNVADLESWLDDQRHAAFVLGPGFGSFETAHAYAARLGEKSVVLDADAITAFKDDPASLFTVFDNSKGQLVLTPHEGEFARLFPDIASDQQSSKVEKAQAAAARSHGVIVYKGADTVIAAPDGRALINDNAPPYLATAGSGDVLAGIIGALLAQGMPAFEAAAAGVWMHGAAANRAGAGMTAEDLVTSISPP